MELLRFAIFDVDGTLVDSFHNIVSAVEKACIANNLEVPTAQVVRRGVGLSVDEAFSLFLPEVSIERLCDVVRDFENIVQTQIQSKDYVEPLYAGVHECLQQLEKDGVLLGIATGNSRRGLDAFLERQGLEKMFINTKTADENPGKPNPEMLIQAMKEVGAESDMTVMIGDTVYDILMAGNAGVGSIGVSWGSHGKKELLEAGANEIIDSLSQTKSVFDKITLRDVT